MRKLGVWIFMVFVVSACSSEKINYECSSSIPPPPGDGFILSREGLSITPHEEGVEIKEGDVIPVWIENLTSEQIWIAKDYGIRLSEVTGPNKLRRVKDLFDHTLEENTILEPNGESGSMTVFFVKPKLQVDDSTEVFIFIWGSGYRNGQYCSDLYGGGTVVTVQP